jgi:LAS superfamily LD-carboxypeptidase LdcB
MHRLDFIKLNVLAGLGFSFCDFNLAESQINPQLLTGKSKPNLNHNHILEISAFRAYKDMHKAALKDDINISIISGYRSFKDQLRIWNKKYYRYQKQNLSEEEIFSQISTYSAIPGTSRHHWGTEIDIINLNAPRPKKGYLIPENYSESGIYNTLYQWMMNFGQDFGFYLVYTNNEHRNGFRFEPWHFSYKPLASKYLRQFSELNLTDCLKNDKIGCNDYMDKNCLLSYFHTHLLGINPLLLP